MPHLRVTATLVGLALLAACGKTPPAPQAAATSPTNPGPVSPAPVAPPSAQVATQVQSFQLISSNAADAARLLNAQLNPTNAHGTAAAARVDSDARTNTVIVTATQETLARAAQILEELEQQPDTVNTSVFFIHHVDFVPATDITPVLNQIFGNPPATQPTPTLPNAQAPGAPAFFIANPGTNSVLVLTDKQYEPAVRALISQIDRAPTAPASKPASN